MFSSTKKTTNTPATNNVETLIGKNTSLNGTLNSEGSIRIEGNFEGIIISKANVLIGPNGNVKAEITAQNVTISGKVMGNVSVDEKLELMSGSLLNGDIKVKKLVIEEGAVFRGVSETKNEETKVEKTKAATTESAKANS